MTGYRQDVDFRLARDAFGCGRFAADTAPIDIRKDEGSTDTDAPIAASLQG